MPAGIAIAPDGTQGFVANSGDGRVLFVQHRDQRCHRRDRSGSDAPTGIAIVPNEGPTASFLVTPQQRFARRRLTFQAGASSDPDGTIANYAWDWATANAPRARKPAAPIRTATRHLQVTLTVTDNEGCSSESSSPANRVLQRRPGGHRLDDDRVLDPNGPAPAPRRGRASAAARPGQRLRPLPARGVRRAGGRSVVTTTERRSHRAKKRRLVPSRVSLTAGTWSRLNRASKRRPPRSRSRPTQRR